MSETIALPPVKTWIAWRFPNPPVKTMIDGLVRDNRLLLSLDVVVLRLPLLCLPEFGLKKKIYEPQRHRKKAKENINLFFVSFAAFVVN